MITLDEAKDLSEKKWQYIVDNNGSSESLFRSLPEFVRYRNYCSMCEYSVQENNGDVMCDSCLYTNICDDLYGKWVSNRTKETALVVLEAIKARNCE